MINENEIAIVQVGDHCSWTTDTLRMAFDTMSQWTCDAHDDWWLGASAPGIGKGYRKFRGRVRRLTNTRFEGVKSVELVRLAPGGRNQMTEWSVFAFLSPRRSMLEVGSVPSLVGAFAHRANSDFSSMMRLSSSTYGFLIRQPMWLGPQLFGGGLNLAIVDDPRQQDTTMTHSWWGHTVSSQEIVYNTGLLRDIYPESYLSESYLNARLGHSRTTLKQWIEADPTGRGTLEPYTDILTKWTPPVEKIPQIREELYRAGRVYYWQFFCPPGRNQKPSIYYRPDLSVPWEAPDPIPEIYRADYWKDKDPGLTY